MAVKSPERAEFTAKDYLDAREALIRTELNSVADRVTTAVSELKTDMDHRFGIIDSELKLRPTSTSLHKTVWSSAGAIFLGMVAVIAVVWNAFGTGASMTSSFSDKVISSHAEYQNVSAELSSVNAKYDAIDARYDKIDSKLNRILASYSSSAGSPPRPKK